MSLAELFYRRVMFRPNTPNPHIYDFYTVLDECICSLPVTKIRGIKKKDNMIYKYFGDST